MGASVFFAAASELATLTNTFYVGTAPTDPSTITLITTSPAGVQATYTFAGGQVVRDGTGIYHRDCDVSSESGEWRYDWIGTGTAQDHQTGTFLVQDPALQSLYATPADLKSRLGLIDQIDDFEVYGACFGASRAIDACCDRFFSTVTETRTFEPMGYYRFLLPAGSDLVSVTSLKTDATGDGVYESTWATTDYQLLPQNAPGPPEPSPYTEVKAVGTKLFPIPFLALTRTDLIQITGTFGWPVVPYPIRAAAMLLATELFKMKDAPLGIAGIADLGIARVQNNPIIAQLIAPYMRAPTLMR